MAGFRAVSEPRRVLVTGAAGFIGSHVVRELLDANCDVAIVVRPGNPLLRLSDVADRLTVVACDLADAATLRATLAAWRPDACIHLAWYAEPGKYLTAPDNVPALMASLALLDELIHAGCGSVVMTGTCAEYDTDVGYLREGGPTRPLTLYAASKLSLCLMAEQIASAAGIDLAWARLFYLYGPHEDERRLVPALIGALSRGEEFPATAGAQVRDYLHVEDVATALVALARRRVSGTVNVSSGVPVTMRQVMETIGEIAGGGELIRFGAVAYRDWDPPFICGDNRRLRETTDWQPRYPTLRAGLCQTVDWWKARQAA
jgi:nucleoside-diphosphate-sugar epimerase